MFIKLSHSPELKQWKEWNKDIRAIHGIVRGGSGYSMIGYCLLLGQDRAGHGPQPQSIGNLEYSNWASVSRPRLCPTPAHYSGIYRPCHQADNAKAHRAITLSRCVMAWLLIIAYSSISESVWSCIQILTRA